MTETRAVSIEDVRMLVAERQRYDDWLSALEARRAETPARVFERVHGDYSGRRSAVLEQLNGHVAELATLGDELDARLSKVDSELSTLEDERAEAMLRTAVGEFDGNRWETVRQEVESKIAEVTTQRVALLTEVGDVRALLASARSEPAPPPVASQSTASAEVRQAEPAGLSDGSPPGTAPHDADADAEGDTELLAVAAEMPSAIALQSTSDIDDSHGQSSSMAAEETDLDDALALFAPPGAASSPAEAGPIDLGGIEAIEDGAPDRSRGTRTATMTPPSPAAIPAGGAASTPAPAQSDSDPFDDLAFLRSVTDPGATGASSSGRGATNSGTEPQKTLRCTECGTMNFPTEWYCERCGGELAAF
jgi:hypothetical protein